MNLDLVYDRAYENAMRQGYVIDGDVLRACIDAIAHAEPPFEAEQFEEIMLYIKEKPELLPTDPAEVPAWRRQWVGFFTAYAAWRQAAKTGTGSEAPVAPLLCDFGL